MNLNNYYIIKQIKMRVLNILAMIGAISAFKLEENESVWYAKQGP